MGFPKDARASLFHPVNAGAPCCWTQAASVRFFLQQSKNTWTIILEAERMALSLTVDYEPIKDKVEANSSLKLWFLAKTFLATQMFSEIFMTFFLINRKAYSCPLYQGSPVCGLLGTGLKLKLLVAQSCPTLCDPMSCSLPGSSVHGISQARILEWVAASFSRGSSPPRDRTCASCIAGRFFTVWATREAVGTELHRRVSEQSFVCISSWSPSLTVPPELHVCQISSDITFHRNSRSTVTVSRHPQMGSSSCRKTSSRLPLFLHYCELYNYFITYHSVIIIEIKCTINVICLNHPETIPHPANPGSMTKLSSTWQVLGAKNIGDYSLISFSGQTARSPTWPGLMSGISPYCLHN